MSRSYRKPYSAITGTKSAKDDKRIARRAVRRMENQRIRDCKDFEELLMPERYECTYNDVWSWGRDGKQSLHFPPNPKPEFNPWSTEKDWIEWYDYLVKYYLKLHRK